MKKEWMKYSFRKYNKNYPQWFNQEKNQLIKSFKPEIKSFNIEHVGSTAIPGLGGKGIIDIAILVKREKYLLAKKKVLYLGYLQWKVPSWKKRLSFKKYPKQGKRYNLHLTYDLREFKKMIFFRNFLIKNPEILKEYKSLKQKAAKTSKNHGQTYRDFKAPFIKSINRRM
jgi:GrpB-like predicted nucleotidyltransferase (UPF0157 family)